MTSSSSTTINLLVITPGKLTMHAHTLSHISSRKKSQTLTLTSRTPPAISVLDYLSRLSKHATLTPALLLTLVYYIDRLCSLYPAFTITSLTVHRFLITASTVASKGLSDAFWNNSTYARVGGLKLSELGRLELDFLYRMEWRIVPDAGVLKAYYGGLVERNGGFVFRDGTEGRTEEEREREAISFLPGP